MPARGIFSFLECARIVSMDRLEHTSMILGNDDTECFRFSITLCGSGKRETSPLVRGCVYWVNNSRGFSDRLPMLSNVATFLEGLSELRRDGAMSSQPVVEANSLLSLVLFPLGLASSEETPYAAIFVVSYFYSGKPNHIFRASTIEIYRKGL